MIDHYFAGNLEAQNLYQVVEAAVQAIGQTEVRVSKSQVAFYHGRAFAWVWMPEMYLHRKAAPLVLSIGLRRRAASPRWKEVVEPYPGRFTHHLELYSPADINDEVSAWLREAWTLAEKRAKSSP